MYVENLCDNCIKGPFICDTKNCKSDRVLRYQTEKTITIANNTKLIVVEVDEPDKATHIESENIPQLLTKEEILSKNFY